MTALGQRHAGWRQQHAEASSAEGNPYRLRLRSQTAARAYLVRQLRQLAATADNPEARAAIQAAREDIWYGDATRVIVTGIVYELYSCRECAKWKPEVAVDPQGTLTPTAA